MVEKLRVAVIDDEPLNREELIFLLSLHPDVEVIGAAGEASAAWKLIEDTRPNLVFLDIQMAGDSSGLDLGRRLKRLPRPPLTPSTRSPPTTANPIISWSNR
jgi:DNA-binding LytR/AlgR family response regulator